MRPGTFQPGHRKTGGRQPGTPNRNKLSREAMERACIRIGLPFEQMSEITPLQAMQVCLSLSLEAGDRQGVLAAAGMMAPYVRAAVAQRGAQTCWRTSRKRSCWPRRGSSSSG